MNAKRAKALRKLARHMQKYPDSEAADMAQRMPRAADACAQVIAPKTLKKIRRAVRRVR